MPEVPFAISDLATANLPLLCSSFESIAGHPPPATASAEFLRFHLAWHLQAVQEGRQPKSLRERLLKKSRRPSLKKHRSSPGTRLIREWQGKTYEVIVGNEDYLWRGKSYRSLSQIATTITGTRWSGPRFFGVPQEETRT